MKKYLVLGSSGQIGGHLVSFLRNMGHHVIEFDIERTLREDLRVHNSELLSSAVRESDFVFFLAFDVGGSKYLKRYQNTFDFINNNVAIMHNTFKEINASEKPFLFASSQMADMGHSTYGVCKSIGEKYTEALGGINVKMWNVYGREADLEKSHVITDFIRMAKDNKKISMMTTGTEQRQFLHAEDCCECLYTLSEKYGEIERDTPCHVTSFEWVSISAVAEEVAHNFEDVEIEASKAEDSVHCGWKKNPDRSILEHWKPKIGLREGIKDVIAMMRGKSD
jgi:nucleoside-diphosphate-sugar epimerase